MGVELSREWAGRREMGVHLLVWEACCSDLHPCLPASTEDCHRGCPVNGGHSSVPELQGPVLSEGQEGSLKKDPFS